MIGVEVFGETAAMETVAELLDETDGVSRVMLVDATGERDSTTACAREGGRRPSSGVPELRRTFLRCDADEGSSTA